MSDAKAPDAAGNTPLHLAALRNDADAVDALLAQGADAGTANAFGATPLHYAIGNERIVAALLARGAPADTVSKVGVTPLLGAVARADSFAVARRLIAAGANVNHRRAVPIGPDGGASVLAAAILGGDRRTIALLLEKDANVNPPEGTSPLCAAAFVGDGETARLLLDRGADPNYRSNWAGTALNFALHARNYDVARLLLERGADATIPSTRGHATPPMVLSAYNDDGDPSMARLLLAREVDLNAANDYGETALSYALKRGPDTPLVRFLREAGAKPPALLRAERPKAIPARDVPDDAAARAALIRDRAQRAVELLQRNSTAFLANGFVRQVHCVSCHQQSLPAVAFGLARERGLRLDEHELGRQLHATVAQLQSEAENAREMDEPMPNPPVSLGFHLDGLSALHYAHDDATDAFTRYLLGTQRTDGSWIATVRRPPMEDGSLVGTAWAVRAIQLYPVGGRPDTTAAAARRARDWLARQTPATHNERVFQLLGLAWSGETPARMRSFAEALVQAQRADGGWAQLPALECDAWATGSALVALHKAGVVATHPAYRRGVAFLLRTQYDDGSWWVRSRSWPFQPHFDGQFPHGKDQWISAGGTAWATIALLLTLEPAVSPATLPDAGRLIATFTRADSAHAAGASADLADSGNAPSISFARQIKPLIERSCAGCHVGEKIRGGFSLASREAVLKGGQSGEPAIVPGRSGESNLLRFVAGEVEDLEMPPLNRREKYPALTADEIALVRAWIDAGAPWADPAGRGSQ